MNYYTPAPYVQGKTLNTGDLVYHNGMVMIVDTNGNLVQLNFSDSDLSEEENLFYEELESTSNKEILEAFLFLAIKNNWVKDVKEFIEVVNGIKTAKRLSEKNIN